MTLWIYLGCWRLDPASRMLSTCYNSNPWNIFCEAWSLSFELFLPFLKSMFWFTPGKPSFTPFQFWDSGRADSLLSSRGWNEKFILKPSLSIRMTWRSTPARANQEAEAPGKELLMSPVSFLVALNKHAYISKICYQSPWYQPACY